MTEKYPSTVYIKWEEDDEDKFLLAGENPADISESESEIYVGEYVLHRIVLVKNQTRIEEHD